MVLVIFKLVVVDKNITRLAWRNRWEFENIGEALKQRITMISSFFRIPISPQI